MVWIFDEDWFNKTKGVSHSRNGYRYVRSSAPRSPQYTPYLGRVEHKIVLTTYEVKGYSKTKEGKWSEPAFGDGLDQAIIHLHQGADNSWLVYPDLGSEKGAKLGEVCTNFAPRVGVLFVTRNGVFLQQKASVEAPITAVNEQQKRKMLARLITSGTYSRIHEPDWARKHEY